LLAAGDEAGLVQQLELFGDVSLARIEPIDYVLNAHFAGFQLLQDCQPGRFREGTEHAGHTLELIGAEFHFVKCHNMKNLTL
jgi:hypothetical protein